MPCTGAADGNQIGAALERIEHSVDPCGESAQVLEILETLTHCPNATYQICTDSQISRNVFDRPIGQQDVLPRVISWNPLLRSELEPRCDGDSRRPVLRDPTASLLHELVHAAHDCRGLNPGEYEIEAVRVENIYRRAVGLCQRTAYGEDTLPPQMVKRCTPERCRCSTPDDSGEVVRTRLLPQAAVNTTAAENGATEQ